MSSLEVFSGLVGVASDLWACPQVVMRPEQTVEEGQQVRRQRIVLNRLKLPRVCVEFY